MLLAVTFVAVAWALPLVLLAAGLLRPTGSRPASQRLDWRLIILSTLLCTIAFNLTFFLQELFLVVPKALVPGLNPTLYHNDHEWAGKAPVAELLQGTGAVAILISALIFKIVFDRTRSRSPLALFALWMAFEGAFQGLPQVVLGAILPGNDVGRAYGYLKLSGSERSILALLALAAFPIAGIWIGRSFLSFAPHSAAIESWRGRAAILIQLVCIPAVTAVPLIIPFRIPREFVEVALLPLLVELAGAGWVLAAAWTDRTSAVGLPTSRPNGRALLAVLLLLAFFQVILRPGIRFY